MTTAAPGREPQEYTLELPDGAILQIRGIPGRVVLDVDEEVVLFDKTIAFELDAVIENARDLLRAKQARRIVYDWERQRFESGDEDNRQLPTVRFIAETKKTVALDAYRKAFEAVVSALGKYDLDLPGTIQFTAGSGKTFSIVLMLTRAFQESWGRSIVEAYDRINEPTFDTANIDESALDALYALAPSYLTDFAKVELTLPNVPALILTNEVRERALKARIQFWESRRGARIEHLSGVIKAVESHCRFRLEPTRRRLFGGDFEFAFGRELASDVAHLVGRKVAITFAKRSGAWTDFVLDVEQTDKELT